MVGPCSGTGGTGGFLRRSEGHEGKSLKACTAATFADYCTSRFESESIKHTHADSAPSIVPELTTILSRVCILTVGTRTPLVVV